MRIFFLLLFLAISCSEDSNGTRVSTSENSEKHHCERINSRTDLNSAEEITLQFYKGLNYSGFDGVENFFSKDFWEYANKEEVKKAFIQRKETYGEMKAVTLQTWQTYFNCFPDTFGSYQLVYQVEFEKGFRRERLVLEQGSKYLKVSKFESFE